LAEYAAYLRFRGRGGARRAQTRRGRGLSTRVPVRGGMEARSGQPAGGRNDTG
jgi:hypothetical protein